MLVNLFGAGEDELKALGASHVSKHVSAALSKCAEQIFASGYRQLLACQGGKIILKVVKFQKLCVKHGMHHYITILEL